MRIFHADCRQVLPGMSLVDAVVTDPPYGLSFMGKGWDHGVPGVEFWRVIGAAMKPGAHLLAFGGTRTFHRLACAIEDSGFEIRDCVMWVYGTGFPKSLDVSKAIDKRRYDSAEILEVTRWICAEVKRSGRTHAEILRVFGFNEGSGQIAHWTATTQGSQPAVPMLEQVPRLLDVLDVDEVPEQIQRLLLDLNGRKGQPGKNWFRREVVGKSEWSHQMGIPLPNTYSGKRQYLDVTTPATDAAKQWDGWGTALKPAWEPIILARKPLEGTVAANVLEHGTGALNVDGCRIESPDGKPIWSYPQGAGGHRFKFDPAPNTDGPKEATKGRWPANLIHDGSEEVVGLFPETKSQVRISEDKDAPGVTWSLGRTGRTPRGHADSGSAARFFYCAKASKRDRGEGNDHPTVKPTDLMRYLCQLITPPGGMVLDPFMGSGSTGKAALLEGFGFVGIDQDERYCEVARKRLTLVEEEVLKDLLR